MTAPVLVVDRPDWIQANADGFAALLTPMIDKVAAKKGPPGAITQAIGSRITGGRGRRPARASCRARCWASSTRSTSRTAGCCSSRPTSSTSSASWASTPTTSGSGSACTRRPTGCSSRRCRGCASTSSRSSPALADTVEPQRLLDDGFKRLAEALKSGQGGSLLDLMGSPEQKAILDRVTAVMSLLEGHADVVMDGVGPERHPQRGRRSVPASTERRKGVGTLDRMLRKLLGLEAKMAQYRDGARVRPRRRRQGRHGRLQRRLGRRRATCRPRPRSTTRTAWVARVLQGQR